MPTLTPTRRLLRSNLVDLLVGPHGIDRYLELIRPEMTVRDARARVIAVRRQTDRSVTLTLRPNGAWVGLPAGQFVRSASRSTACGERARTRPPASEHGHDGTLELTITDASRGSRLAPPARRTITTGTILHLGPAQGEFVLPADRARATRPDQRRQRHHARVCRCCGRCATRSTTARSTFVHYARTAADWLYRAEVDDARRVADPTSPSSTSRRARVAGTSNAETMARHARRHRSRAADRRR